MLESEKCPKCGLENTMFSKKRQQHICEDCGHTWDMEPSADAPSLDDPGAKSVFLSYARGDDEEFVRKLHDDLKAAGFDDPRLLANCPHCGKPLKFNPFFVDMGGKL